jgi:hypothetical protein
MSGKKPVDTFLMAKTGILNVPLNSFTQGRSGVK